MMIFLYLSIGILLGYFLAFKRGIRNSEQIIKTLKILISTLEGVNFNKSTSNVKIDKNLAFIECILPNGNKGMLTVPLISLPSNCRILIDKYDVLEYRENGSHHVIGLPVSCHHTGLNKLDIKIKSYPDTGENESNHIFIGDEHIKWDKIIENKNIDEDELLETYD